MHKLIKPTALLSLWTVSSLALATPCDSALASYSSAIASNLTATAAQIVSNHPECFGGSPTTSNTQINATSFRQVTAISQALENRFGASAPTAVAASGITGLSAGGASGKLTGWANVSNTDTRQSYGNLAGSTTHNQSDVLNAVFGADYRVSPTLVAGLSVAIDRTNGSGFDDSPTSTVNINIADGFSIAPYVGWQLNKEWSLDASAGWGKADMSAGGVAMIDIERWFAAANANYNRWMGAWQFAGKASLLHGEERYDDIVVTGAPITGSAATNKLDQLRVGAQAGYWLSGWMPYGGLQYTHDLRRSTTQFGAPDNPIGRQGWTWVAGLNYISVSQGLTAGLTYTVETGRGNQKRDVLMGNVSLRF